MKTLEYRVRPVTRYVVTEFEYFDGGGGRASGGSREIGEFDNFARASEVAAIFAEKNSGSVVRDEQIDSGVTEAIVIRSIGELIAALTIFPCEAVPIGASPPFTGVRLIPQDSGCVLIASPLRDPKSMMSERAPE